ncbi:MAG: hypothetical protein K8R36_02610 [Planctomycetales bacterium]|nr:hypothetical protein [Planctomycetales bacterium]
MQNQIHKLVIVVTAWCISAGFARADGLIFQLPPDGTWAKYAVTIEGEVKPEAAPKIAMTGTLSISSVGEITRSQQKCRWIELKFENPESKGYKKLLLKMLVPVDRLKRGDDPLSHSILTFFDPKPIDEKKLESFIDEGFNRVQYEIDRFRMDFPAPLDNPKNRIRETVETPAGKFEDCEVVTGTYNYDGPILGGARSLFNGTYRITIHPKAPFGVVSMKIKVDGREIHDEFAGSFMATKTLVLAETGKNAVSDLPEANEKKETK